jgi:hypothetical protein
MKKVKINCLFVLISLLCCTVSGCRKKSDTEPIKLKTQATVALSANPAQTIKGWGCFIGNRNGYGALNAEGPLADAIFSMGITNVRTSIEPETYLSGTTIDDIVLDNAVLNNTLSTIQIIKNRGLSYFLSIWSPPAVWKLPDHTTLGSVNHGTTANPDWVQQYLDPAKVQEYCNFYVKVLQALNAGAGLLPTHISIQNEPNVPPSNYSGCSYHPIWHGGGGTDLWQTVIKTMRKTLDDNGLGVVRIHGTDDGQPFTSVAWLNLFGNSGFTAFDTDKELLNAIDAYAFHTYGYTFQLNGVYTFPAEVVSGIKKYPKDCWMTEWNDNSQGDQLADAINTARHFATDLETTPYTHWIYWIVAGWETPDNPNNSESLIGSPDGINLHGSGYHKNALILKKIWNIVRPNDGWQVKSCTSNDSDFSNYNPATSEESHLIAFNKTGQSVVLIVNASSVNKTLTVKGLEGNTANAYLTTSMQDISPIIINTGFSGGKFTMDIPARCVTIINTFESEY